jgi:hypothetical protein
MGHLPNSAEAGQVLDPQHGLFLTESLHASGLFVRARGGPALGAALPCFSQISAPLRPRQEPWFLVHVLVFPGALRAVQGPYMHCGGALCGTAVDGCWCICDAAADSRSKEVQGIPHQPHPSCAGFDSSQECLYQDCLHGLEGRLVGCSSRAQQQADPGRGGEDSGGGEGVHHGPQWAF